MTAKQAEPHVILRGKDEHGYALSPRSSCCNTYVVYLHGSSNRYATLMDDAHVKQTFPLDLRCGLCNRSLSR